MFRYTPQHFHTPV